MKLFIANIDKSVDEVQLKNLFSTCGLVIAVVIVKDRSTGAAKEYGFIEMPHDDEAQLAIEKLDGKLIGGRILTVGQAKPKMHSS